MITPSHVVYNLYLLGKRKRQKILLAIVCGAIFPDIFSYSYFLWNGVIQKVPPSVLWGDLYIHSLWAPFFQLAHSFWLLPLMLLLALYWKKHWAAYFWGSALIHAIMDFTVHHKDAYMHFYPFSKWRFESPISYWDIEYYGLWVSRAEMVLAIGACIVLFRRAKTKWGKLFYAVAAIGFLALFILGFSHSVLRSQLMGG
ncbi:MAG: hypothetical protein UY04_C0039G0005 [Parcubacteria group bacterium GW2011_GWA2_47_7]|nr:MAG: hypothetical protein UY04_C0039G0005 [Parcubacteria group bacterium GW2011_GWA2_47_7]